MNLVQRLSAFSATDQIGGNPAGVVIANENEGLPSAEEMQRIAAEVGYSETAFAVPLKKGDDNGGITVWRVRYFSPEAEVAFCGHATIALGAALAEKTGKNAMFPLQLNHATISVEGKVIRQQSNDGKPTQLLLSAVLQSPPTHSSEASQQLVEEALLLFGYKQTQLDARFPPAVANGGNNHLMLMVKSREALSAMKYDLHTGRKFMNKHQFVTVLIGYYDGQVFHTRNPFASGGVYEDPATGAATAALAGYLRDIKWAPSGTINVIQGEDMGSKSLLVAEFTAEKGSSIRVSGIVRKIDE